ncbi:MAG: PD40 domain-containing protein [Candidatus Aminicenantes bacterium]|nr:PD40 domain-containing protein [Candidatus Aminicenantes bacterium]
MKKLLLVCLILSLITMGLAVKDARLLRFPDINKALIAFVYAGDIWTVPAAGGDAKRLTSHKGLELFPKISPDGKWIAFSAEYSGSRQVYVMPAGGGSPKQLTYYNDVGMLPPRGGFDNITLDWTPCGKYIMVRANRTPYGERKGKYFLVNIAGGFEKPLPIPEAGFGSFSPDGKQICFNLISREFRTWKRYKGGSAADIWIYDLKKNHSRRITKFPGTDHIPSWYKDKIYFASDRDLVLNIYEYDLKTGKIKKVTDHREFDVMWPSGENGLLVYENGGYIYKLDLNSGQSLKVTVNIYSDNPATLPYFKKVSGNIYGLDISPTGKRAVFDARGDIFTVPAKEGITENLTASQGVREIFPKWSPDGKYIAYYSDRTGEYEIYLQDKDGREAPVQLTENSGAWRYAPVWSPDSKKLLFSDKRQLLQILDIQSKEIVAVDKADRHEIRDYDWAPGSAWVVYTKNGQNGQFAIWAYSLKQKKIHQLTGDMFNDYSPVFSTCGKYLYFRSDRDFNLAFSDFEFNYIYNKATKIYAVALKKSTPPLFKEKNDKEEIEIKKQKAKDKKDGKKETAKTVEIDFDHIGDRVVAFPLKAGDYMALAAVEGGILYANEEGLFKYDIVKKKKEAIIKGARGGVLSADRKKLLYRGPGKQYGIIDIEPNRKLGDGKLDLKDLTMKIDPVKEWQQVYNDGWRIFRDWFYVRNIHGVDWQKMKKKYEVLLPHVSHRADLDYIFGELVGESNTGHCYVNRGDSPRVKRVDTGLLGAELKPDKKAGRYIIAKIYRGENWNKTRVSPLTVQGIDIREGDYLIRLNKHNVTLKDNPYKFLENTVGKRISIVVNNKPQESGARTFMIKPIASEQELFYLDWVESRRKMVDKLSGGKIGYIHVPDTAVDGNRELFRGMYAFHNKEALIIDERYNGGGFIPNVMTDLLGRTTMNYAAARGIVGKTPGISHDGPKAMLMNYSSGSGGDAFPYYFKMKKLGVLIGTRTWGGLVGLSGNAALIDGGLISVPTFGFFDIEGKWMVEGIGVYPDIEVYDTPHLVAQGKDPCIEKAVEVLLKELKTKTPRKMKKAPADPDRSKWHEKKID